MSRGTIGNMLTLNKGAGITASIAFVGENDPAIPDYSYTLSWTGGSLSARTAWEWQSSTDGTTWGASTSEAANAASTSILISLRDQIRYFRVREVSATENGPWSNVVQAWTEPNAPSTLTATSASGTQINLSWKDNSSTETGFVIERRSPSGSGSYSVLATVGPSAGSGGTVNYSDTGLTTGQSYQYRVAAVTPMVNSAYSAAASATPTSNYEITYLVIAGGGGGGSYGGGGAGGYRTATGLSLTPGTSYTVTVGGGGAGNLQPGDNGNNSSLSGTGITTITSTGGGGGGGYSNPGKNGGSGGGGGTGDATGSPAGTGTSLEGSNGGAGVTGGNTGFAGGGGGGSGGTGAAASGGSGGTNALAGSGGAGTASSITGSSVTRAGGGGGGSTITGNGGGGGSGGGGTGGTLSGGGNTAGSTNGGSGGGGRGTGGGAGSNGGSGVVILRIPAANFTNNFPTGTPTVTDDGSFKVVTFTSGGSYVA